MNGKNIFKKTAVIWIIALLLGLTSSLSTGKSLINNASSFSLNGNVLYVGGNGPNNYSSIQEAIIDASNGDTVFVYDESSPYTENILIDKSINVMGENRETVIIDGGGTGRVVSIEASDVTICGFTLQNSGNIDYNDAGVGFGKFSSPIINRVTIRDNKMINNYDGIYAFYGENHVISDNILTNNRHSGILIHGGCKKTIVTGNTVTYNEDTGIHCQSIEGDEISNNIVTNNPYGIYILCTISNIFHNNIVKNNNNGFAIWDAYRDEIYRNQIENNDMGLYCEDCAFIKIYENNYVNNKNHATFYYPWGFNRTYKPNWISNYWQGTFGIFPKIIKGHIYLDPSFPFWLMLPWFDVDYNPARKPFQI